jgi:predicted Ser/Thr protein kinase
MWENARPFDHWKVWCGAECRVNPLNVGTNFYSMKSNYNFTSKELLDIIGKRMLNIANMTENGIGLEDSREFNEVNIKWLSTQTEDYWVKKYTKFKEVFGNEEAYIKACTGSYDMKKLKKELTEMKKIIRTLAK